MRVASDVPSSIKLALETADRTECCTFEGDLEGPSNGEYGIDAIIGPHRTQVGAGRQEKFRVRFLIPESFPYKPAHTVPLDPPLKWHPHQDGNWPRSPHANVMCPPRIADIDVGELLLEYVRYAYQWIEDALNDRLVTAEQRFEMPHVYAPARTIVYVEGGTRQFEWYRGGYGVANLMRITKAEDETVYRVTILHRHAPKDGIRKVRSEVRSGVFGDESQVGICGWMYAESPVVEDPHRPAITWSDWRKPVRARALRALQMTSRFKNVQPLLLLAHSIPMTWGATPTRIAWRCVLLRDFTTQAFLPPKGFRRVSPLKLLPGIRRFVRANDELTYVTTRDVSKAALTSRRG